MKQDRLIKAAIYQANEQITVAMPEVSLYHKIQLRGKIDVTISGGSTSGTPTEHNPLAIIKRIDLQGDGSINLYQASGTDIFVENYIDNQLFSELVGLASGDAQANTLLFFTIDLNFEMKRKIAELRLATILNATVYENLELKITFGNPDDLITGGDRAIVINSFIVNVSVTEETDLTGEIVPLPTMLRKRSFLRNDNILLSDANDIELSRGTFYNRLLISALDNGLYSNSLINNIQVRIDDNLFPVDEGFNSLRGKAVQQYRLANSALPNGFVMVDFDKDMNLTGVQNSKSMNRFVARFDTIAPTGVKFVRIMTDEFTIIPLDT